MLVIWHILAPLLPVGAAGGVCWQFAPTNTLLNAKPDVSMTSVLTQ